MSQIALSVRSPCPTPPIRRFFLAPTRSATNAWMRTGISRIRKRRSRARRCIAPSVGPSSNCQLEEFLCSRKIISSKNFPRRRWCQRLKSKRCLAASVQHLGIRKRRRKAEMTKLDQRSRTTQPAIASVATSTCAKDARRSTQI